MGQPGLITMSMRELDRLKVVEAVIEQRLMPWRAAERLGISRRQIERLVARYRAAGPAGLLSQRRGHASNHQLPEDLAHRALSLIRERYADFGPTLACEKLWECHGIRLAKETVRRLMTDAGLWIPRRQRRDEPADGAALHADRIDLQLLRGHANVSGALRQASGLRRPTSST